MAEKIKGYDFIVYYRGGAGREYFNLMREACKRAGKTLVYFGYKYMGDINELSNLLELVEQGQLAKISRARPNPIFSTLSLHAIFSD